MKNLTIQDIKDDISNLTSEESEIFQFSLLRMIKGTQSREALNLDHTITDEEIYILVGMILYRDADKLGLL